MPPRRKSTPRSPAHAALGEAIRRLRLERGLAQEDLADRVETDFTQIGGIERGLRNPSWSTLLRIAAALETRAGEIAGLADRILDEGVPDDQEETSASAQTSSTSRSHSGSTARTQRR
jgi:transcriptional regulator with XRE-family HTH domain